MQFNFALITSDVVYCMPGGLFRLLCAHLFFAHLTTKIICLYPTSRIFVFFFIVSKACTN